MKDNNINYIKQREKGEGKTKEEGKMVPMTFLQI